MKFVNVLTILVVLVTGVAGAVFLIKTGMVDELLPGDVSTAEEEAEEEADADRIRIIGDYKAIRLDDEQLESFDIEYQTLEPTRFSPEFTAWAEAVDISPLVAERNDFENLLAEIKIKQNELASLRASLKRARALHEARSLSTRELEQHRAEVDRKTAELNALKTRLDNQEYRIRSEWGDFISDMALGIEGKNNFNSLAMHDEFLVILSLPKNRTLDPASQGVYISHASRREDAIQAEYIGRSKKGGNPLYGESHIYRLSSNAPHPGMRLYAWIEETGNELTGLYVPDQAVVWYANEPWLYIRHDKKTFVRKPVANATRLEGGWLVSRGIQPDEQVVTSGGQTLLSEEFKWAIPDEDDD